MDKNTAQALCEVIQEAYANDRVKKVFTPFALVEEMLYDVNLHGDILVVSDLGFLPIMAERNVDFSRVTFIAHTPEQFDLATEAGCAKVFQVGYNSPIKEMERHLVGMKFDVVVGNPPYQAGVTESKTKSGSSHSLWPKFLELVISLLQDNGNLLFITPDDWRNIQIDGKRDKLKSLRDALAGMQVRHVWTRCDEKFFSIGQSIKIDGYFLIKNTQKKDFCVTDTVSGITSNARNGQALPRTISSTMDVSILGKISARRGLQLHVCSSTFGFTNDEKSVSSLVRTDTHVYPALTAPQIFGAKTSKHRHGHWLAEKHPLHDEKKVVISWNHSHAAIYDDGNNSITNGCIAICVQDKIQGEAIVKMLNGQLAKFVLSKLHKTGDMRLPKYWASFFPVIESEITDNELYQYFHLSNAEIEYINQFK